MTGNRVHVPVAWSEEVGYQRRIDRLSDAFTGLDPTAAPCRRGARAGNRVNRPGTRKVGAVVERLVGRIRRVPARAVMDWPATNPLLRMSSLRHVAVTAIPLLAATRRRSPRGSAKDRRAANEAPSME